MEKIICDEQTDSEDCKDCIFPIKTGLEKKPGQVIYCCKVDLKIKTVEPELKGE